MIGNPEELRAAARRIRAERGDADFSRRRLQSAGSFFDTWKSPASSEFHRNWFDPSVNTVDVVSDDLGDLADMLDRAAAALDERIAQAKSIESRTWWWFNSQPAPEDGSPPIWEQQWWRYRPGRFPGRGDSEWFEVQRYLRGLGVYI